MNIDSALLKLPDTLKEKKMQSNYCMLRVVDDDTDSPFKIVPDEFDFLAPTLNCSMKTAVHNYASVTVQPGH